MSSSRIHPYITSTQNSIVNKPTNNDDNTSQFTGGSSASSSHASSLAGKSIVNSAGMNVFNFISTLREKESMVGSESSFMFMWMIFYHVYLIYNSIVVSLITTPLVIDGGTSTPLWGVIPGWIWRTAFFPMNFASEFYPFYLVVSLSALFLVAQLLTFVALYYCKWASRKGGKLFKKVKSFVLGSLIFQRTFTMFIISIHAILITPNITNGTFQYFPDVEFGSIQIAFISVGCVGLVVNIALNILATYLTAETSAQSSNRVLFSLFTISPFAFFNLVNQLSLMATIICPSPYSYIASAIKIALNALLLIVVTKSLPFFRKWENSVYLGLISLKTFTPIPPLILQFLTNQDQQLMGGIMSGVALLVAIMSFIGGYTFGFLWIKFKLRSIRQLISNKDETANICQILDQSKQKQENLSLFIRFAMRNKKNTEEGSDFDLAKYSANNFVKFIENSHLLTVCALFVSFGGVEEYEDSQSFSIGLALLQKAQRTSPSLMQLFDIILRTQEIEFQAFNGNNLEVLRKLATVEKKVKSLSRCHKSFFKELLNDRPSIDKLESINKTSCSIYNECDTVYENLLLSNRSNKTVIRSYASYLEKYKWEINLARDLFEEAQENEEEKKPLPLSKPQESFHKTATARFSLDSRNGLNNENWDSVSVEEENEDERKDTILRSAINTPMSTVTYSVLFILFCVISIVTIGIIAPVALAFSDSINQRMLMQEKVCLMTSVPYKLLTQIGALQTEYYVRGNNTVRLVNSTTIFTQVILDTMANVIYAGDNNQLLPEVAKEYLKNQYELKIPITNSSLSGTTGIPEYRTANTSIQFYLTSMYNQGKTLFKQFNKIEQLTSNLDENYQFLFLYYNKDSMSSAFNAFCSKFVEESIIALETNFQFLWITLVCVLVAYLVTCLVYFAIIYIHTRRLTTELKEIFRKITKDEIGKVYHNFDKKIDDSVTASTSSVLKTRNIVMCGSVLLTLIVCICSGMIVVELHMNTKKSSQSMSVVGSINAVALRTSRTNSRLIELIQRRKYQSLPFVSLNRDNKEDLLDLRSYWNFIVVGDESTDYSSVVVGKYQDVDYILGEFCNDTIPIDDPCHSLTNAITEYIVKSLDYNEIFFAQTKSPSYMTSVYFSDIFYVAQTVTTNLQVLISALVNHEKISSVGITAGMIVICVLSTLSYALICYTSMRKYWSERKCVRMMLNYINLELIDNNIILKDYVMTNTVPSSKVASRILSRFESGDESEDKIEMVKTILNGGVDSAIICDKDGNITIFNNSAEEMFGYSRSQVLGDSIQSLFTGEYSERITKLISTGESHDSFEALALRKNKTSFSSKVSVSISIHEKKQILIVFVRDITPEKKQSILIAEEKKKSEDLLLNILPITMASRLKNGEENLYEKVNDITVFFSDMVGFTAWSSNLQPSELVQILNLIVQGFDKLTEIHLIDKIKTIGDAYFCVSGLHSSKSSDHPERMLRFAIEVMAFLKQANESSNTSINLRIGIHTGDAVGGVIGFKKFAYDLWGDTINTASRMESTSLPGRIQISRSTYGRVYDLFEFEERMVEVKGKGLSQCYLLKDKHHDNPIDLPCKNVDEPNKYEITQEQNETN